MDVFVYKTVSGTMLYESRERIKQVITKTLPGATVIISVSGAITIAGGSSSKNTALSNEKAALKHISSLLGTLNNAIVRDDVLGSKGIPALFPKELKLRASSKLVNGDGQYAYDLAFDLSKKPSSREKSVPVLNAEMTVRIMDSGQIEKLHLNLKPITQKKTVNRLALRIDGAVHRKLKRSSGFPEMRYYFDPGRQFIVPLYKIYHDGNVHYFPASEHFV